MVTFRTVVGTTGMDYPRKMPRIKLPKDSLMDLGNEWQFSSSPQMNSWG